MLETLSPTHHREGLARASLAVCHDSTVDTFESLLDDLGLGLGLEI